MYVCVAAPGCSPAGIPGQSSRFSAGQFGPERPAAPGSDGRCGSSGHPSAAGVSLAVEVKQLLHHLLHPVTLPRVLLTIHCFQWYLAACFDFDLLLLWLYKEKIKFVFSILATDLQERLTSSNTAQRKYLNIIFKICSVCIKETDQSDHWYSIHIWRCTSSSSLCFTSLSLSSFCCKLRAFISSMACFFSRSFNWEQKSGSVCCNSC